MRVLQVETKITRVTPRHLFRLFFKSPHATSIRIEGFAKNGVEVVTRRHQYFEGLYLETDDGKTTDGKILSNRCINNDLDNRGKRAEQRDESGPFTTRNLAAQDILNALNHIRSNNGAKRRSYAAIRSIVFTLLTGLDRYKQLDGTYFKERFDFCATTHAGSSGCSERDCRQ